MFSETQSDHVIKRNTENLRDKNRKRCQVPDRSTSFIRKSESQLTELIHSKVTGHFIRYDYGLKTIVWIGTGVAMLSKAVD